MTYLESEYSSTMQGSVRAWSPRMTPVSSMRLLVVLFSPPLSSFLWGPYMRMHPQPPGPGLPEQAPSVYKVTVFIKIFSIYKKKRTSCALFLFVKFRLFLTFHNFHRVFHIC